MEGQVHRSLWRWFLRLSVALQQGNRNQGWKDSSDAIVYEDGGQVDPPISTCEEQAFVYVAKLRMAEILWVMGDRDLARKMFHEASELKKRFNDRFWMHDKKFFALGLDSGAGRSSRSVRTPGTSCLRHRGQEFCGPDRSPAAGKGHVYGWGVRTLFLGPSSLRSLQLSSRFGLAGRTRQLRHGHDALRIDRTNFTPSRAGCSKSATLFDYHRPPECFSGHPRDGPTLSRRCIPGRTGPRRGRLPVCFPSCKLCWASIRMRL